MRPPPAGTRSGWMSPVTVNLVATRSGCLGTHHLLQHRTQDQKSGNDSAKYVYDGGAYSVGTLPSGSTTKASRRSASPPSFGRHRTRASLRSRATTPPRSASTASVLKSPVTPSPSTPGRRRVNVTAKDLGIGLDAFELRLDNEATITVPVDSNSETWPIVHQRQGRAPRSPTGPRTSSATPPRAASPRSSSRTRSPSR